MEKSIKRKWKESFERLWLLNMKSDEFEFTEEEFKSYVRNHFHTYAEIDNLDI